MQLQFVAEIAEAAEPRDTFRAGEAGVRGAGGGDDEDAGPGEQAGLGAERRGGVDGAAVAGEAVEADAARAEALEFREEAGGAGGKLRRAHFRGSARRTLDAVRDPEAPLEHPVVVGGREADRREAAFVEAAPEQVAGPGVV